MEQSDEREKEKYKIWRSKKIISRRKNENN